jgi:PAS domain S-box-containing protein
LEYEEHRAVDVTERNRMEEALRRQTELIRAGFNSAKGAIFILDAQNPPRILDCNQAASNIFGYQKSEMLGKTTAFLHVSDTSLREFQSLLYPAVDEGLPFQMDFKMKRKDGSAFSTEHSVSQLLNDKGERIGWVSVVRDITDRKRADEAMRENEKRLTEEITELNEMHGELERYSKQLQESQEKLRALHQHALQLGSASNIDDIVKSTLDAIEFALGFDVAEVYIVAGDSVRMKGARGAPIGLSEERLNGRGMVAKAARTQTTVRVSDTTEETDYVDRKGWDWTGPPTMLSELAVPIIIEGKTAGVLNAEDTRPGVFSDNDQMLLETLAAHVAFEMQRLRYVQEIRRSSQFLGTIIDNANVWVNVLDERKNVVIWNRAAETMSGYSRQEVMGHGKIWEWLYPDQEYRDEITDSVTNILQGRVEQDVETRIRRKDGETRVISWNERNLLGEHGEVIGSVAIGRDVTERKRMQKELEQYSTHLEELVEARTGALHESERKYRQLVETAREGLFTYDTDGAITFTNHHLSTMLGYAPEEMVGKNLLLFVDEGDVSKVKAGMERRRRGIGDMYEVRLIRKDGLRIYVSATTSPIMGEDGKFAGGFALLTDITERKRTEQALRASEERFRELADLLPQIVFEIDNQGYLTFVNRSGLVLTGYTEDEIHKGLNAIQVFAEKDRDRVRENIKRILAGQNLGGTEYVAKRRDGSIFPVIIHSNRILKEGEAVGIRGIVVDITERKRMEEALRVSEERFRGIAERSIDGIFELDLGGRVTYVSPSVEPAYGYKPAEVIGTHMEQYFPEFEIPKIAQNWAALMEGRNVIGLQAEMLRKDGTRVSAEMNASPILKDGKIVGVQGILRDITERAKMENALRESEQRYRRLFESSPVPLWEEDFSEVKKYFDDLRSRGVKDLRRHFTEHPEDVDKCASMVKILNVNESTLRLYEAKSVEELTGELRRVLTPDSQDRFREELIALSEGKTRFADEFNNRTLTGETKHVSLILSVVPSYEDTLAKVLISTIDLTEHRKMEQRLQQAERLAAVGETAAMVGHDLRNPLQGIAGALHLLKKESLTEKERDEMLQLIQDSVHYSDAIVRDLVEYSTEIHLEPIKTTPKSIITNAVRTVRIPEKITLHDLSQEHPIIMVDQDRMRRVIVNIIENAIDAMQQGGALTISSARFNGTVEIDVSDTGTGMPEKVMQNLWKPLQTTKAKGLGLGLAICKRIVNAHGGTISVDSKAGQGTTVTIRLPLTTRAREVNEK